MLMDNPASLPSEDSIPSAVHDILTELSMPMHLLGYKYTAYSIYLVMLDSGELDGIVKGLYPKVASVFGSTGNRVERSIRHAIEYACLRSDSRVLEKYFGSAYRSDSGKITNAAFIANVAFAANRRIKLEAYPESGNISDEFIDRVVNRIRERYPNLFR